MRIKKVKLSNFARSIDRYCDCIRPETERELSNYLTLQGKPPILARGAGLSYNDCCFNSRGIVVNSNCFNHYISLDEEEGIISCQGHVRFADLLYLHPDYIPPVIPGTLHATLAGGIAHDIHGKNNHRMGSLGHWVEWIELILNGRVIRCSKEQERPLYQATIAGLGLTGIITRLGLRLNKASKFLRVDRQSVTHLSELLDLMVSRGLTYDYQVAWLDLLNPIFRAVLSVANHSPKTPLSEQKSWQLPQVSINLIRKWNLKFFNQYYFHKQQPTEVMHLAEFNNPLDKLKNWQYLYGKKGLIQFQAVFASNEAQELIEQFILMIRKHKATPSLAVLKLFTQHGTGLLSFVQPGFTLAIDFINNNYAHAAITEMNRFVISKKGRIYLAKDLLLTQEQYEMMYENHEQFLNLLQHYQSPMQSDLAKRLGITNK